jgi:hypothetical protein
LFVAITIFLTGLTVWLLVTAASRQRHQASGDIDVFRYPTLYQYFFGVMFWAFAAIGVYTVHWHPARNMAPWEAVVSTVGFGAMCVLCLYGLSLTRWYRVVVSERSVKIYKIGGSVEFTFDQVHSMTVLHGYRGARDLRIFDDKNGLLLSVGGTIQDFDELVWLIRSRCSNRAVVFRERDAFGKWH